MLEKLVLDLVRDTVFIRSSTPFAALTQVATRGHAARNVQLILATVSSAQQLGLIFVHLVHEGQLDANEKRGKGPRAARRACTLRRST